MSASNENEARRACAAITRTLIVLCLLGASACGSSSPPAAGEGETTSSAEGGESTSSEVPREALASTLPPRRPGERVSPSALTTGTLDGVEVAVSYGRPSVRGREIFGALVPYGQVWRTGADEATAIAFSRDVVVEGQPLPAGVYGLFTVPSEGAWTVVLNRRAEQWGAYDYDASQDALRVEVTPVAHAPTEQLEIAIEDGALRIRWAGLEVPVRVTAAQ